MPSDRPQRRVDRSQLPDEFTPETVRAMGFRTARLLANPANGVLTPEEQAAFDRALRGVMQAPADRLGRSVRRARHGQPLELDPDLRRSYQRTQQRLDAEAERTRRAFPHLTDGWGTDELGPGPIPLPDDVPVDEVDAADAGDDVSIGTLAAEIEQTSDTLDILEQIASLQQQQLEHQRSQLLSETRGLFFALAVSIAVIIAGVAPLVEASPHDRRLILLWTAAVCVLGGLGYAAVRARQARSD